jgi:integrase
VRNRKAKRANGEGTIWFDHSRNRYRAQYFDNNGKRRSISDRSHSELAKKLRASLELRDRGMLPKQIKDVESLSAYLQHWLTINKSNWEFKTIERYESDIRLHIEPILGSKKLTKVNASDIEILYNLLRTQHKLSDYSVLKIHSLLSAAFKRALKLKRIQSNPMESVLKPVVRQQNKKTLTEEEVGKVLKVANEKGEMWSALWHVTLWTGLRQGEVLGLMWKNLDLETGKLTIDSQIQRQTGIGLVRKSLKQTGTSRRNSKERFFYVDSQTLSRLKAWKTTQNKEKLACANWIEGGFVFTNGIGKPLEPRRTCAAWRVLLEKSEVTHTKLHNARSTFTTLAIKRGIDVKTVSHYLGHSDLRTTIEVYLQVTDESLIEAAKQIETVANKQQLA